MSDNRIIDASSTPVQSLVHGDNKKIIEYINKGAKIELVHVHADLEVATELSPETEQHQLARGSLLRITATGVQKVSIKTIEG